MKDLRTKPPENWVNIKVNNLISNLSAGVSVNSGDRPCTNGEIAVLKTSSLDKGRFIPLENKVIIEEAEKERAKRNPRAGTIIISRMNTPELVGDIAYVEEDYKNLFLPDRLWLAKIKDDAPVNTRWLSYKFTAPHFRHNIRSIATGTSGSMKNISQRSFLNLPLTIPPKEEQDNTVKIISNWDEAISLLKKITKFKKRYKKGLMQQLLSGKKRFPEFEGEEWQEVKLSDLTIGNRIKGKSVKLNDENLGIPYIGSTSFAGDFNEFTQDSNAVIAEKKDLLLLWDGEYAGKVTTNLEGAASSTVAVIKLDVEKVNNHFLKLIMEFDNTKIRAITEGSGIPHIPTDFISWYKIKLPRKKEQDQIVNLIGRVEEENSILLKKIALLKKQKKGLMQQLLTGKVRVNKEEVLHG